LRVSILGAGAVAYGAAAFLARAGHDPLIWSPSGARTAALAAGEPLVARNAI
jgi:opine dehydrogenase